MNILLRVTCAWSETSTDCLSRGWNNPLKPDDHMMATKDIESDTESAEISGLFQELGSSEKEDWLNDDYLDPGFEIITDEEIVSHIQNERNETEVDSDSDNEQIHILVTPSVAYEALGVALEWWESLGDIDIEHLLLVKRWRDRSAGAITHTQLSIRQFLNH